MDSDKPPQFRENDVIRVVKQPANTPQKVGLIGGRGFVTAVRGVHPFAGRMYGVHLFREGAGDSLHPGGEGVIPEECLARCTDPEALLMKKAYDSEIGRLAQGTVQQSKKHGDGVDRLAKKHGIEPKVAKAFLGDYLTSDFRA